MAVSNFLIKTADRITRLLLWSCGSSQTRGTPFPPAALHQSLHSTAQSATVGLCDWYAGCHQENGCSGVCNNGDYLIACRLRPVVISTAESALTRSCLFAKISRGRPASFSSSSSWVSSIPVSSIRRRSELSITYIYRTEAGSGQYLNEGSLHAIESYQSVRAVEVIPPKRPNSFLSSWIIKRGV